jgi:hypothetical protein
LEEENERIADSIVAARKTGSVLRPFVLAVALGFRVSQAQAAIVSRVDGVFAPAQDPARPLRSDGFFDVAGIDAPLA